MIEPLSIMNDIAYDSETTRWLQEEEEESSNKGKELAGQILSNIFLFFLIFGLSATVEMRNLKRQLTNKFAIGCGVGMQFIIMPLLGFTAVASLKNQGFTQAMGIALLVVTSSPGGSYSNWWCSMFNADLALSVAMTTVSSLLSIGLLPLNLFFYTFLAYGTSDEKSVVQALDFGALFISLGIVLSAIIAGLSAGYRWDTAWFHLWANRAATLSGILLILFSVFLSAGSESSNFWSMPWSFYVGVAGPCLVGITLANLIARSFKLSPPETVAIAIECCYQNTGIATSVAITMFDGDERAQAVAVPLFYGVVEAVAICIYCVWAWKAGWTKAPADEKLCIILSNTYEVEDERQEDEADPEDPTIDSPRDPVEAGVEVNTGDHPPPSKQTKLPFWRRLFRKEDFTNTTSTKDSVGSIDQPKAVQARSRLNTAETNISTPSPHKAVSNGSTPADSIPEEPQTVE